MSHPPPPPPRLPLSLPLSCFSLSPAGRFHWICDLQCGRARVWKCVCVLRGCLFIRLCVCLRVLNANATKKCTHTYTDGVIHTHKYAEVTAFLHTRHKIHIIFNISSHNVHTHTHTHTHTLLQHDERASTSRPSSVQDIVAHKFVLLPFSS